MSEADSAARRVLKNVGEHLYRYREPYIGTGLGMAAGGALGYLPKKRYRSIAAGRRLKRPAERKKTERIIGGIQGAVIGGAVGLNIGSSLLADRMDREFAERMGKYRQRYQQSQQDRYQRQHSHNRSHYGGDTSRSHYGGDTSRSHYGGGRRYGGDTGGSHYGGDTGGSHYGGGRRFRAKLGPTPSEAASGFGHSGTFKTKSDVKKAFRAAANKHHPDRPGGSEERMKAINDLYDQVKNSEWYSKLASGDPFMAFFYANRSQHVEKSGGMSFLKQDRPDKVKSIYKALKRDHPNMPEEVKARIASRKGKKSPESRKSPKDGGPAYKAPLGYTRKGKRYVRSN